MKNRIKVFVILITALIFLFSLHKIVSASSSVDVWQIRSIDTIKTSRDLAREKNLDSSYDENINSQVKEIKDLGANYIAIDTPYDTEFIPYLKTWVNSARKYDLHVWFRGNWSSWEGWFNYPKNLTREKHLELTKNFILNNPDLFKDGDIFTACPECEYGGPGSPLATGDVEGFRKFMLEELPVMKNSFKQINKQVIVNYTSMNPDVAKKVLDESTVKALGNILVLDEYTKDVDTFKNGLDYFIQKFQDAKIVVGEFGAPIPDINGQMTDSEQSDFVNEILSFLHTSPEVVGLNYWVNTRGSTALFDNDLNPKPVAAVIKKYFHPGIIKGEVTDENGKKLSGIIVTIPANNKLATTDANGEYSMQLIEGTYTLNFGNTEEYSISTKTINITPGGVTILNISLKHTKTSLIDNILKFFRLK